VGTLGVGIMNSMAFLLLANNNTEVNESQKMELTIGSLSFYVRPFGSTRLLDLAELGPSMNKAKTITLSRSSVGSSSEVNSPVSFVATENTKKELEKLDGAQEEPDEGVAVGKSYNSQKDLAFESSDVSRSVHQLCVIITEAAEENGHEDNAEINTQVDKSRSNGGEGENPRLQWGVENYHVSYQPRDRSTRQFKKGSFNGISICIASTQEKVEEGKR
jgi:hypothetical protein